MTDFNLVKLESAIFALTSLRPYFYEENGCMIGALGTVSPLRCGYRLSRGIPVNKLKYDALIAMLVAIGEMMGSYDEWTAWISANGDNIKERNGIFTVN